MSNIDSLAAAPVEMRVQDMIGLVHVTSLPVSLLAREALDVVYRSPSPDRSTPNGRVVPVGPKAASYVAMHSPASAFDSAADVPLAAPRRNASRALESSGVPLGAASHAP